MTYEKAFKTLLKTIESMKTDYQYVRSPEDTNQYLIMEKFYILDNIFAHGIALKNIIDETSKEKSATEKLLD